MSKPKLVQVTWLDATRTADDISKKDRPVICKTVGYLLYESRKCVVIGTDKNKASGYRGGFVIPRGMVKKVKYVG